jgi:hypothetical protein
MWIVARVSLDYFSLKFSYSSNPLLRAISSLFGICTTEKLSPGRRSTSIEQVEGHTLPTRHYTRLPRNLQSHLNSTDSEGCSSSTERTMVVPEILKLFNTTWILNERKRHEVYNMQNIEVAPASYIF